MSIDNPIRPPRSLRWPLIVVGLLVGHATLMAAAIYTIHRDNRDSVVPDYYQKSLDWDRNHAPARPAGSQP